MYKSRIKTFTRSPALTCCEPILRKLPESVLQQNQESTKREHGSSSTGGPSAGERQRGPPGPVEGKLRRWPQWATEEEPGLSQGKRTAPGGCPQREKNTTERLSMFSHTEESLNEFTPIHDILKYLYFLHIENHTASCSRYIKYWMVVSLRTLLFFRSDSWIMARLAMNGGQDRKKYRNAVGKRGKSMDACVRGAGSAANPASSQ